MRVHYIFILLASLKTVDGYCVIPDALHGHSWQYRNSHDGHAQSVVTFTADKITFRSKTDHSETTLNCEEMVDVSKFILSETESSVKSYKCVEILPRSKSIVQIKSSESSSIKSRNLCSDAVMKTDPWLLVAYELVLADFSPCPFSGGFNMKVIDKSGVSHGCNYMELPMRFESDCLAGEGITFNFRENECAGFIPMSVLQKTMCLASWHEDFHIFVVIKTLDRDNKLWILRLPKRLSTKLGHAFQMQLFSDLIALDSPGSVKDSELQWYRLILEKVVQRSLCADEYPNCAGKGCSVYIKQQCPKSCGVCDPNKPLPVCSFPRRFRGSWYMQDQQGAHDVNISDSTFSVKSVGSFTCVEFDDSPPSKERIYATETIFFNGCRPRFTCISFRRLSPSVISYAISQSFTWPFLEQDAGSAICNSDRFKADDEPIGDMFRSYHDTHKPLLPLSRKLQPTNCRLESAYKFDAVIRGKGKCSGKMFQDCQNSSLIRVDYENCRSYPLKKTYACAARFKERYWETLLILQNIHDKKDSACLTFSTVKKNEAILLPTSQCDKYSWQFVDNKLRTADVSFHLTAVREKCRNIPTTTPMPSTTLQSQFGDHLKQSDVQIVTPNPVKIQDEKQSLVKYEGSSSVNSIDRPEVNDKVNTSPRSGTTCLSSITTTLFLSFVITVTVAS